MGHRRPAVLAPRDERPRRRAEPHAGPRRRAALVRVVRRRRGAPAGGARGARGRRAGLAAARGAVAPRPDRPLRRRRPHVPRDRRRRAVRASALPDRPGRRGVHRRGLRRPRVHDARAGPARLWWSRAAVAAAVLGAVFVVIKAPVIDRLFTELRFIRGTHTGLAAILDAPAVRRDGAAGRSRSRTTGWCPTRAGCSTCRERGSARAARSGATGRGDLRHRPEGAAALRLRRRREPVDERARTPGSSDRANARFAAYANCGTPRTAGASAPVAGPGTASSSSAIPSAGAAPTPARSASGRSGRGPRRAAPRPGASARPACARSAAAKASASAAPRTARSQVRTPASGGVTVAPPEPGVLDDPVGQRGVVERLDAERDDPDVGAEDQPRAAAASSRRAEPDELRRRPDRGEVRVALGTRRRAGADQQQRRARRRGARRRRAAAPSRCGGRGARARRRRRAPPGGGRRERVGGERHERAPRGRPHARGARARRTRRTSARPERPPPRAAPRGARACGARRRRRLVAVPAPVPELAAGRARRASPRASGYCSGWKMTTTRGAPPRSGAAGAGPARPASRGRRAAGRRAYAP